MRIYQPLALFAIFLLTAGCHRNPPDRSYYAQRAYEESEAERMYGSDSATFDQQTPEDLMIDFASEQGDRLEKLPWEKTNEWIERIHDILILNNDRIESLREELDQLTASERRAAQTMSALVQRNEQLRNMLDQESVEEDPFVVEHSPGREALLQLPAPTFDVHLVKKGDTLYSIAREVYGDPGMVQQIVRWNQGWIRNPDQLIAGLALVLFHENAPEKNEQVVEAYMDQIPLMDEHVR